jgi:hypothetical protein
MLLLLWWDISLKYNLGSSQNFGKTGQHGLKPVAIYRQPFRLNDVITRKKRYFTV